MGEAAAPLDAGVRAALQAHKSVCYVCPPAGWAVVPLFASLPESKAGGLQLLVIGPELPDLLDLARGLRPLAGFEPILAATGIARTSRLLGLGAVRTLVATPRDAIRLLQTSHLASSDIPAVALAWPEFMLAAGETGLLDTLLAEAGA